MRFRCLSVRQPSAALIALGDKLIEVRPWETDYRGHLLIASSKNPPIPPAGYIMCEVELIDCRPFEEDDLADAVMDSWRPGLFAWDLKLKRAVVPVAVKGRLGIYEVALKEELETLDLDSGEYIPLWDDLAPGEEEEEP